MALNLITFSEKDFGGGIDSQSPPNQIGEGFVEDARNADPRPTGPIAKRRGYQGYAGNVPVRIKAVESAGTALTFLLDEAIDLSRTRSTPIIVYGRAPSSTGGDLSASDSVHYYPSIITAIHKTFSVGSSLTLSVPATEHLLTTPYLWVGCTASTSEVNSSNSVFWPDYIQIDKATNDIDVVYTNATSSAFSGFVYYADRAQDTPNHYVGSQTTAGGTETLPASATTVFSIPQAVHLLSNNQLLIRVFEDTGTHYRELMPDKVTINKTTGQVQVTITNGATTTPTIFFSISYAPTVNYATGAVGASSTNTVQISTSILDDRTPFVFLTCYLDDGINPIEQVIPDSIVVDADAETIDVTFQNGAPTGANFSIYWQFVALTSSRLTVTQSSSATYTDTRPQLTLWGLDHADLYSNAGTAAGWTTHLDSYRAVGESRVITGLGGNLFDAQERAEGSNATALLMPELSPSLKALLAADTGVGPAFWETGDVPGRTRGYITGSSGGSHVFEISTVSYDSGLGWVKYVLSVPSMSVQGTLSTIIQTTTGLEDILTVTDTSFAIHNGDFAIKQVTAGANLLNIWVSNPDVTTSDWDIAGAGGEAGIFTDRLTFLTTSPFIAEDKIRSDLVPDTDDLRCVASSTTTMLVKNVFESYSFPAGLTFTGARTSDVIPLRTTAGAASVENLVRGDLLSYTGLDRQFRVKYINELADISVTIAAGDGSEAIVTLGSGNIDTLWEGEKVLLRGGLYYNGAYEILELLTDTTFSIASTITSPDTSTLIGRTVHLDESFEWADTPTTTNTFVVPTRWAPIEAPDDTFALTPSSYIRHFDVNAYDEQPLLRSTMVKDSLYLTNGSDEVFKMDGSNLYRAGLPRWQPHLFVSLDTTAAGLVVVDNPSAATTSFSQNRFTLTTLADKGLFQVGDRFVHALDSAKYTVREIQEVGGVAYLYVDRTISGTPGASTITRISTFRYYFRLNSIDVNNNILATAAVGADDFVVEMAANAAVNIRLTGLPAWDIYDYDRLEVQIYRTKANAVNPFYLVTTLSLPFAHNDGYLDYVDTASDDDLVETDVLSVLIPDEPVLQALSEPLRARYVTSAGNRLILGNIKDWPTLDIQLLKQSTLLTQAAFVAAGAREWLFRKDNTDTATTTNMVDRAKYVFTDVASGTTTFGVSALVPTAAAFTVTTSAAHGLASKDWVYLFHSTNKSSPNYNKMTYAGWWQVASVPAANQLTIEFAQASPAYVAASDVNSVMKAATVGSDIPVPIGTDYNYGQLNGNRAASLPYEFLAMKRLADAINASQRLVNTTLSGQTTFEPWLIASAGNEFSVGQLVIRQPKLFDTTMEVLLPTSIGGANIFVNSTKRSGGSQAQAVAQVFPSRLLVSLANFPEMFDNPTAAQDVDSDSAIDVNSADGQEITAIIPFFGESAFGASLHSGVVVVFKTNSIYLVDLAQKAAGQNPVQRIESQGKGCTAPYSVTVTKAGIMFANDTGIYRLNRSLGIDYIGRKYEGVFQEEVDLDYLSLAAGHHDAIDNLYKLSYVPKGVGATAPAQVAVYNHVREYESQGGVDGSWTTYTNHPALAWANLASNTFWASTSGRVFLTRRTGLVFDYRDDDAGIDWSVTTRAQHFGDGGIRKLVRGVVTHFLGQNSSGTTLRAAYDLLDTFDDTDSLVIRQRETVPSLGQTVAQKIVTVLSSLFTSRAVYFQLKYENSTKDEPVEITTIDWRVGGLTDAGIKQAKQTQE